MRASVVRECILQGVLVLRDLDAGMSVTNDAEAVVAWAMSLPDWDHSRPIVYRDTMGRYDALAHRGGQFTGYIALSGSTPQEAVARLLRRG